MLANDYFLPSLFLSHLSPRNEEKDRENNEISLCFILLNLEGLVFQSGQGNLSAKYPILTCWYINHSDGFSLLTNEFLIRTHTQKHFTKADLPAI